MNAPGCESRIAELMENDLEPPAMELHPEIGRIKDELTRSGASGALMCGSGSAVFGLFVSSEAADAAARRIDASFGVVFRAETVDRVQLRENEIDD